MWIACFNIRMKVVLNVKVSRTVGVGADQDPAEKQIKKMSDTEYDTEISKPWHTNPELFG